MIVGVTFVGFLPRTFFFIVLLDRSSYELGQLDVDIASYCGGHCSCGTCRVDILHGAEALTPRQGQEAMVLGSAQVAGGERLACQARVLGPVTVQVTERF